MRTPIKKTTTDKAGEVREVTKEDMSLFRPIAEVDPGMVEAMAQFRRKVGRPKVVAPKVLIGFRLSADVVKSIKASGRGYNVRIEQILREAGFGGDDRNDAASRKASGKRAGSAKGRRAQGPAGASRQMTKRRA